MVCLLWTKADGVGAVFDGDVTVWVAAVVV